MPTTTNPATPASLHALSRHALARMQQRGIPAHALDCLFDYGRELHAMDQVVGLMFIIIGIGFLADKIIFSPWERFLHRRWGLNNS